MLTLPYNFRPRPYQLPVLRALDSGIKRAVVVWHRRAGKEKTLLSYVVRRTSDRVGTYWYVFPTYKEAKRVIWQGKDGNGFAFLDHFPPEYVAKRNESDLRLELINGSAFQLIGSDQPDSLRGPNPIGVVFAEYAEQDPMAWEVVRPIVRENGGFALFDFTPRGKNHGWDIYQTAKANPKEWFCELLTVDDTGQQQLAAKEREAGMPEEMVQQEYYCSWEGVKRGSIFGKQLQELDKAGQICGVPWMKDLPVDTWWDPGYAFAAWFTQTVGREIHVIDFYDGDQGGPDKWAHHLQSLPYVWGKHWGPPDLMHPQYAASGRSTAELLAALGFHFDVVPLSTKEDQIGAADRLINRCWFDRVKTEKGRNALLSYHFRWDEKRQAYSEEPYHDWSSHAADAFMVLGLGHKFATPKAKPPIERAAYYSKDDVSQSWMA